MLRKLCFAFLSATSLTLNAQTQPECPGASAVATLYANNLRMSNIGFGGASFYFGNPQMTAGYNGVSQPAAGMYAHGLWVGGLAPDTSLHLAAFEYFYGGWGAYDPGPLDANGAYEPLSCARWNRIWEVSRYDIERHLADFTDNGQLDDPIPAVLGWPGLGNPYFELLNGFSLPDNASSLAPFFDLNGDGIYNAYEGDYPHPKGLAPGIAVGQIAWSIFNGARNNLQFDFQATLWALACDDNDVLNNTIFQSVTATNRAGERLDSVVIGIWQDPDLGNYWDDYIGTNSALNSVFVYNADNSDQGNWESDGFGENPPATAITFLNRPLYKTIAFNGHSFWPNPAATDNPVALPEYYHCLNGHWRDDTPLTFGGTGYNPDNPAAQIADFIFPGDPSDSSAWAMTNVNPPFVDRRLLSSVYFGTMLPGASQTLDLAYSFHRGPGLDHLENVSYGAGRVAQLHQLHQEDFAGACNYTTCTDDCVWPGDTNRDGIVNHCDLLPMSVAWDDSTGIARDGFANWAPQQAEDWGQIFNQSYDFKHLDPNGDGVVSVTDRGLLDEYYGNTNASWTSMPDEYPSGYDFRWKLSPFDTNPDSITTGKSLWILVYYDSLVSAAGAAFTIEWDTVYWQFLSGGGNGGASYNVFKGISHTYPTQIEYARIATDHHYLQPTLNNNSHWLQVRLQARAIAPAQSGTTYVRLKNIKGIAADGSEVPLGAQPLQFHFVSGTSAEHEPDIRDPWRIFPNPAATSLTVEATGERLLEAVFYDASGQRLGAVSLPGVEQAVLPVGHLPRGLVFVQLRTERGVWVKKVVLGN